MAAVRVCTLCSEENLEWAQYCSGCQASLSEAPLRMVRKPLRIPRAMLTSVLQCVVALLILVSLLQTTAPMAANGPKTLQVLWHKFYGNYGQEWIVGEVRNASPRILDHVLAVGEYYTDDGRLVTTAAAPLEIQPLAPGKTSYFKVTAPYNGDIEGSLFHFQTTEGEQISFRK